MCARLECRSLQLDLCSFPGNASMFGFTRRDYWHWMENLGSSAKGRHRYGACTQNTGVGAHHMHTGQSCGPITYIWGMAMGQSHAYGAQLWAHHMHMQSILIIMSFIYLPKNEYASLLFLRSLCMLLIVDLLVIILGYKWAFKRILYQNILCTSLLDQCFCYSWIFAGSTLYWT